MKTFASFAIGALFFFFFFLSCNSQLGCPELHNQYFTENPFFTFKTMCNMELEGDGLLTTENLNWLECFQSCLGGIGYCYGFTFIAASIRSKGTCKVRVNLERSYQFKSRLAESGIILSFVPFEIIMNSVNCATGLKYDLVSQECVSTCPESLVECPNGKSQYYCSSSTNENSVVVKACPADYYGNFGCGLGICHKLITEKGVCGDGNFVVFNVVPDHRYCMICPKGATSILINEEATETCQCEEGYTSSGYGLALECTCKAGFYIDDLVEIGKVPKCKQCPDGTSSTKGNSRSCDSLGPISSIPCSLNQYIDDGICKSCPKGSYSDGTEESCICNTSKGFVEGIANTELACKCNGFIYGVGTGALCDKCVKNTIFDPLNRECVCKAGYFSMGIVVSSICKECPVGSTSFQGKECICGVDFISKNAGNRLKCLCPENYFLTVIDDKGICMVCPEGAVSNEGSTTCVCKDLATSNGKGITLTCSRIKVDGVIVCVFLLILLHLLLATLAMVRGYKMFVFKKKVMIMFLTFYLIPFFPLLSVLVYKKKDLSKESL